MYTEGSSALKTEYYTHENPRKKVGKVKSMPKKKSSVSGKRAMSGKKDAVKRSAKSRKISAQARVRAMKKRVVFVMAIMFAMAIFVLQRYAVITEEYSRLNETQAKLELVNAKVVEAQMLAEGNLDPKKMEQEAERLGLRPPTKSQIKYISLGNVDNGEVLKTEETSSLNAFVNGLAGILEYLY